MAEQLGLRQLPRDRGAVEPHQRSRGPVALGVQERGDQLLSRSRLTPDEDRDVLGRDPRNRLQQLAHRGPVPDNGVAQRFLRGEPAVLDAQGPRLQRPIDHHGKFVGVEGLGQVIVGAALHRVHGHSLRPVRGKQDHRQRFVAVVNRLDELHSVHARHGEIGDDGVHAVEVAERFLAGARDHRLLAA